MKGLLIWASALALTWCLQDRSWDELAIQQSLQPPVCEGNYSQLTWDFSVAEWVLACLGDGKLPEKVAQCWYGNYWPIIANTRRSLDGDADKNIIQAFQDNKNPTYRSGYTWGSTYGVFQELASHTLDGTLGSIPEGEYLYYSDNFSTFVNCIVENQSDQPLQTNIWK